VGHVWDVTLGCLSSEAMDNPSLSDGDKVLLPPSTLQEIMARVGEGGMPHPMLFKLEWGGAARHVGVLID